MHRIKADPTPRSIPIIAVTSYALSGEEKKARAAGCDDYVPKPFSPRQLLAKFGSTCNSGWQDCVRSQELMSERFPTSKTTS